MLHTALYQKKNAIADTTQVVVARETSCEKPHGAQQCKHRLSALRLTTTMCSTVAFACMCTAMVGRAGSMAVLHHGHVVPHFRIHSRQAILSASPFSMHEGHLKYSRGRSAVIALQQILQCSAMIQTSQHTYMVYACRTVPLRARGGPPCIKY